MGVRDGAKGGLIERGACLISSSLENAGFYLPRLLWKHLTPIHSTAPSQPLYMHTQLHSHVCRRGRPDRRGLYSVTLATGDIRATGARARSSQSVGCPVTHDMA